MLLVGARVQGHATKDTCITEPLHHVMIASCLGHDLPLRAGESCTLYRTSTTLRREYSESERVAQFSESSCNSSGEHDDDLDTAII